MTEHSCPMSGLERVLLSTDGSDYSSGAIREAISLAKRCSSKLTVLSVVETNIEFSALAPDLVEKEEVKTRQHLESVKSEAEAAGLDCDTVAHEGEEPYRFIVEEADKTDAGLIVMGRRGRSAMQNISMGSVTARVIGHTKRRILVAPRAAAVRCERILLATDGSSHSEAAATEAVDIGRNCGIRPIVISVAGASAEITRAEENFRKVSQLAGQAGVEIEGVPASGRPFEAIVETAVDRDADLIVIGSHGRTGLERLLLGSVAERVINNTECAVLVVQS